MSPIFILASLAKMDNQYVIIYIDVDAVVSFESFRALKLTLFESFRVLKYYDPI